MRLFSSALAICLLWLLGTCPALPCSVPVFRYALDRWAPDRFRLEVPATTASPQRLLDSLGAGANPNLDVVRDAAGADAADARLFFPHIDDTPLWSGKVDEATLKSLVSSPARTEIAKRITGGDTAVWVVVGNDSAETVAALQKRLSYLEKAIALPKIDPNDPTSKLGPGPALAVKFSVIAIRRDDAAEVQFLPGLLGPKRDRLPLDEPILIPVFGRGRALGAWPSSKMDEAQISEAMEFLCGACSCEVKAMNPGWDLLMDADWEAMLAKFGARDPAIAVESTTPREVEFVPIPPAPASAVEKPLQRVHRGSIAGLVGVLGVTAIGFFLVALGRRKK